MKQSLYRSPDVTEFVPRQPMSGTLGATFLLGQRQSGCPLGFDDQEDRTKCIRLREKGLNRLGLHLPGGDVRCAGCHGGEAGLFLSPHDIEELADHSIIRVDRVKKGHACAMLGFHCSSLWWSLPEMGA
jgi:hypothetical protein